MLSNMTFKWQTVQDSSVEISCQHKQQCNQTRNMTNRSREDTQGTGTSLTRQEEVAEMGRHRSEIESGASPFPLLFTGTCVSFDLIRQLAVN